MGTIATEIRYLVIYRTMEYNMYIMPTGIYDRTQSKPNLGIFQKGHKLGFIKGYIPWNKDKKAPAISKALTGKKQSSEHIANAARARIGLKRSDETKKKMSFAQKGKKMPEGYKEYIKKRMTGKRGEDAINWQGGITSLSLRIRNSDTYRGWRIKVFERDLYVCIKGGILHGNKLHVDHIKPFAQILKENSIKTLEEALACEELWNLDNGRTLCEDCHKNTPTYLKNIKKTANFIERRIKWD